MGWWDQHLWQVEAGRRRVGASARLADLVGPGRTVMTYTYDMDDSWEHRLTFTDPRLGEPGAAYPRHVAGAHAAPPEDCGGTPGFYAALEALADPAHPDHEEIAEWMDGYAPDYDELPVKVAVDRIARARIGGRAAAGKPRRRQAAEGRRRPTKSAIAAPWRSLSIRPPLAQPPPPRCVQGGHNPLLPRAKRGEGGPPGAAGGWKGLSRPGRWTLEPLI